MAEAFTLSDVYAYGDVVNAVLRNARVRWLSPDGQTERTGVLRHIVSDESGGFIRPDADVRTGLLRVTTTDTGMELFVPLAEWVVWHTGGYVAYES